MGRWFGYREGYTDLVRLYIGRSEPVGKGTLDLLELFNAMCRDEEEFRSQLAMYEGHGGITPREVPALVFNSHPQLRPTSRNKMFNAKITWAAFDYREPTSQSANASGRNHNAAIFEDLIQKLKITSVKVKLGSRGSTGFIVKWASASHAEIMSVLENVKWDKAINPVGAEIEFLNRKLAPVDSWLFLAPQVSEGKADPWNVGSHVFACVERKRLESSNRFGVFSSPDHLDFAKWLVGGPDKGFASTLKPRKRTGILLFYPTRETGKVARDLPVMGFGIVLPRTDDLVRRIAWSV